MNQGPYFNDFKRRAFEICLAVYRLTNLFPRGEVLTNQIRELANEIAAEVLSHKPRFEMRTLERVNDKISKIIVYFEIAKAQNWLKPINFEVLIREYQGLKEEIEKERTLRLQPSTAAPAQGINATEGLFSERSERSKQSRRAKKQKITERQKKILTYLQEKNSAKMKDFLEIFKDEVTERTLRSDLKFLINQGLIKKQGHLKTTKYFIV